MQKDVRTHFSPCAPNFASRRFRASGRQLQGKRLPTSYAKFYQNPTAIGSCCRQYLVGSSAPHMQRHGRISNLSFSFSMIPSFSGEVGVLRACLKAGGRLVRGRTATQPQATDSTEPRRRSECKVSLRTVRFLEGWPTSPFSPPRSSSPWKQLRLFAAFGRARFEGCHLALSAGCGCEGRSFLAAPSLCPCRLSLLATGYPSPCRLRDSFAAMHGRRPASPKELSDAGPQQHLGVAFQLQCSFAPS